MAVLKQWDGTEWVEISVGALLPVADNVALVKDPTDGTKRTRIDTGAVSTATTRTITMPNADVNLGLVSTALQNVVEDLSPQLGGQLDAQSHSIGYTVQTATGVVGTTDIDWRLGQMMLFVFGAGNETFTFTNPSKAGNFHLRLIQDGVGSRTVTWPTIDWQGKALPTLQTAANAKDWVGLIWDGTLWSAMLSENFGTP